MLCSYIENLVNHNFERLISMLYGLDVNETQLRKVLKENSGTDAGKIIATLIIERQIQKIHSRKMNGREDEPIDEADKW